MITTLLTIKIKNIKPSKRELLLINLNLRYLLINFLKLSQISESGIDGRCHFGFYSRISISSKNSFKDIEFVSLVSI